MRKQPTPRPVDIHKPDPPPAPPPARRELAPEVYGGGHFPGHRRTHGRHPELDDPAHFADQVVDGLRHMLENSTLRTLNVPISDRSAGRLEKTAPPNRPRPEFSFEVQTEIKEREWPLVAALVNDMAHRHSGCVYAWQIHRELRTGRLHLSVDYTQ